MKTCKTCLYFDPSETESELFGNPRGYCRRYPKALLKSEGRWCGEWKEQTNTYNSYDRGYADATNDARDEYAVDMDIERGVAYDRGFTDGRAKAYDEGFEAGLAKGEAKACRGADEAYERGFSNGFTQRYKDNTGADSDAGKEVYDAFERGKAEAEAKEAKYNEDLLAAEAACKEALDRFIEAFNRQHPAIMKELQKNG